MSRLTQAGTETGPEDEVEGPSGPVVSQPGDLWHLGDHLVYCGDALQEASYRALHMHGKAHSPTAA